jgi:peptidoglycan/xylan/chitin deacetylase (PgdA/CDA1 family)
MKPHASPLVTIRPSAEAHGPRLAWAEGLEFRLPASALASPSEAQAQELRLRAAFTERKPASSRWPVSYQKVPAALRAMAASVIGRWQRRRASQWAAFPKWPLDLSADFLEDFSAAPPSPFATGRTPVWLTHDIDSPEGLRNLVEMFLPLEEAAGARSTNFIVPCAWSIDHGLLASVKERGHEIGIHGYDHANRTAFADAATRRRRLNAARDLIERYNIHGYRAPSLLRTRELLRDLAALYRYDSSIPTSGGLFPVPNNGCASARPFRIEGIVEIPLSLPRDGSLRFLGHSPREIAQIWIDCAERISRSGGVVVLLTHCERRFSGNDAMLQAYRRFLDWVSASERCAWSTPQEIIDRAWPKR